MIRLVILFLLPWVVHADDTFRAFMNDISQAEQQIDYSEKLTPVDGIHHLIPKKRHVKKKPSPIHKTIVELGKPNPLESELSKQAALAKKRKAVEANALAKHKQKVTPKKTQKIVSKKAILKQHANSSIYISPSLRGYGENKTARKNLVSVVFPDNSKKSKYGIYIGTKISVQIFETVSNVQEGFIQLKTLNSVIGDKETLPSGSTFFARSSAVIGSERVYLKVFRGLTPDGNEFRVGGSFISSEDESFGLVGRIENDGKALSRAGDVAMNTLGRGIINSVPAGSGVDAVRDGSLSLLNENRQDGRQENGRPVYIVVAEPQSGFIQIVETF